MAGLYIHIPFCVTRCVYCAFYSQTDRALQQPYLQALLQEMSLRRDEVREPVSTVYVGGGTPSCLDAGTLQGLFDGIRTYFPWQKNAEITLECNPDDVTPDFVRLLGTLPINRISMGVQSFDDRRLRFLRRRHTARTAMDAVGLLRGAGLDNLSIDLMFGFPDQTVAEWEADIDAALRLRPRHLSAYCLTYEEGTPLYRMRTEGKVKEISEDGYVAMYGLLTARMHAAGYEHYEISNFALPGYRSRHNSAYWQAVPYMGIGAAAHSYDISTRSWNTADIRRYMESLNRGILPSETEIIDGDTRYNDLITTALRTADGIDLTWLDESSRDYLGRQAEKYLADGRLALDGNRLHLSEEGFLVSDMIMSDLMRV